MQRFLEGLDVPYVLLGDFNEQPGSRMLELSTNAAVPLPKPKEARFTFPVSEAVKELDLMFYSMGELGKSTWEPESIEVIGEPLASEDRPLKASLRFVCPRKSERDQDSLPGCYL